MLGFLRPHVLWCVPERWFEEYDTEKLRLPPFLATDLDDVPEISRELNQGSVFPRTQWAIEQKQWRRILQGYLASISFADHCLGRVLDALEKSPYHDNTIVVLWSDHGYHMGEKNTFQKMTLWERSAHVPLLIAGSGLPRGQVCKRVVSLTCGLFTVTIVRPLNV